MASQWSFSELFYYFIVPSCSHDNIRKEFWFFGNTCIGFRQKAEYSVPSFLSEPNITKEPEYKNIDAILMCVEKFWHNYSCCDRNNQEKQIPWKQREPTTACPFTYCST